MTLVIIEGHNLTLSDDDSEVNAGMSPEQGG